MSEGSANVLRPSLEQALSDWAALVQADKDQVEALPDRPRPEDFYAPVAEQFRADPKRTGEPALEHLRTLAQAGDTWLDLGAGGGRYSLPLALIVRRVYAVEPSAGMRGVLTEALAQQHIENVDVLDERWPGPSACPVADFGLISHVSYDIAEIGPFLTQLEGHVSGTCVALLFERPPIAEFAPLWPAVHGQERAVLPGLREFVALLFARGRAPEVKLFPTRRTAFETIEALHRAARRPLWVREGSVQDERLMRAVEDMVVPVEGGFALNPAPRMLGFVTWTTPR